MEKWMRRDRSLSDTGQAISKRIGPTGETQRTPMPEPILAGSSGESKALPASVKTAARQRGTNS